MHVFNNGYRLSAEWARKSGNKARYEECFKELKTEMAKLKYGDTFEYGHYILAGGSDPVDIEIHSPIKWRVLEVRSDSVILAITDEPLYWDCYHGSYKFRERKDINWRDSDIRKELNGKKYDQWFSECEKKAILETRVEEDGIVTGDRLFLLSIEECKRYLPAIDDRIVVTHFVDKLTDEPIEISLVPQSWWLRSKAEGGDYSEVGMISGVFETGNIDCEEGFECTADELGVRPAMWIDVNKIESLI